MTSSVTSAAASSTDAMNPRAGAASVASGTARYSESVERAEPPSESG